MGIGKNCVLREDLYKWYLNTTKDPVELTVFSKTCILWGTLVADYMREGKDIDLYHGLSVIGIRKRYSPVYVDFKLSREAGKPIFVPNTASNFYSAKIYWKSTRCRFNTSGWRFKGVRSLARSLVPILRTPGGHRKYVELSNFSARPKLKEAKRYKL